MSEVETEVTPPGVDDDEDDDLESCRLSVHVLDVGEVHYGADVTLFGTDSDDPEKGADALVRAVLAAAALRGPDYRWALMRRLVAFDGSVSAR